MNRSDMTDEQIDYFEYMGVLAPEPVLRCGDCGEPLSSDDVCETCSEQNAECPECDGVGSVGDDGSCGGCDFCPPWRKCGACNGTGRANERTTT